MNPRTLKDLRKTWAGWLEATKDKGAHRFVPIDPAVVVELLDEMEGAMEREKDAFEDGVLQCGTGPELAAIWWEQRQSSRSGDTNNGKSGG